MHEFSSALPRLADLHACGLISTEFFLSKVCLLLTYTNSVEQVKLVATELLIRALTGFNAEGRPLRFNPVQWSVVPTKLQKLGLSPLAEQQLMYEVLRQSAGIEWKEVEVESDDPRYGSLFSLCKSLAKTRKA